MIPKTIEEAKLRIAELYQEIEHLMSLVELYARESCYDYEWYDDDGYSCSDPKHPFPKNKAEWCGSCRARDYIIEKLNQNNRSTS